MITLLIMIIILSLIVGALCKLVSAFVGVIFLIVGTGFMLKMAKEILK